MASTRYNARRQYGGKWISPARRLAIYLRDKGECQYCGRSLWTLNRKEITLDHLVSHKYGGTDRESNLVMACKACNSKKANRRWREFASQEAVRRIQNSIRRQLNIKLARAIVAGRVGDPRSE